MRRTRSWSSFPKATARGRSPGPAATWTGSPSNHLIGETGDFMEVLGRFAGRPRVVGGVVHDARIAAICVAHGVEALLTRDRDFSAFPELRTRDPFVAGP